MKIINKPECRFEDMCRELYPDQENMRQKCNPKTCGHYCGFYEGERDAMEMLEEEKNGTHCGTE